MKRQKETVRGNGERNCFFPAIAGLILLVISSSTVSAINISGTVYNINLANGTVGEPDVFVTLVYSDINNVSVQTTVNSFVNGWYIFENITDYQLGSLIYLNASKGALASPVMAGIANDTDIVQDLMLSGEGVNVSEDISLTRVNTGNIFNLTASVIPNGNIVAGMQLMFAYNSAALVMENSSEGNLFNRDGHRTFARIGNSSTKWTLIAIIGNYNTSENGNLATFSMRSLKNGTIALPLNDVKIASSGGIPVRYNVSTRKICSTQPADANCDFNVTAADVGYVNMCVRLGKNVTQCPGGDTNCDNNITAADVGYTNIRKGQQVIKEISE